MSRRYDDGMGILSGDAIAKSIEAGDITVNPFDSAMINPASIDLRLGDAYRVYTASEYRAPLDARKDNATKLWYFDEEGLLLHPGELYLMHTVERVCTRKYVPVLDGKSSIGRLGVMVHVTAGYGDPGFDGQYTLEVVVVHPVRVYAGMRFCQMRFHLLEGEMVDYSIRGNYVGKAANGPVPSKSWKQF